MDRLNFFILLITITTISAGISPVRDINKKLNLKNKGAKYMAGSYKVLQHLDNGLLKGSTNITKNRQTEETLYQFAKDLVSSILTKLEIQDKITRITSEALEAPGKNKRVTAIETRRILDYISRTLSGHILTITKASTEPELHRLVYGLAQIAAEVSIVSALTDNTYATSLSRKQSVDLTLRKKREASIANDSQQMKLNNPSLYNTLLNKTKLNNSISSVKQGVAPNVNEEEMSLSPYSVFSKNNFVHILNEKKTLSPPTKGFLNQTTLDAENNATIAANKASNIGIIINEAINASHYVFTEDSQTLENQEINTPMLDDLTDSNHALGSALPLDAASDIEIDQVETVEDEALNLKKAKAKMDKLEIKAKKAILYAGDVAYLTASSVVAMRRALTASIEVQMSVKYAKDSMLAHQDLMMNLAKTAAQQAGKEAKSASSKSLATEHITKLALKYVAISNGAKLNHVANRIVMDTLSLATLAKSMAFVSSDIAINSLYQATDVKPPSK